MGEKKASLIVVVEAGALVGGIAGERLGDVILELDCPALETAVALSDCCEGSCTALMSFRQHVLKSSCSVL